MTHSFRFSFKPISPFSTIIIVTWLLTVKEQVPLLIGKSASPQLINRIVNVSTRLLELLSFNVETQRTEQSKTIDRKRDYRSPSAMTRESSIWTLFMSTTLEPTFSSNCTWLATITCAKHNLFFSCCSTTTDRFKNVEKIRRRMLLTGNRDMPFIKYALFDRTRTRRGTLHQNHAAYSIP